MNNDTHEIIEILKNITGGKLIAYNSFFAKMFGTTAAVLLCQANYYDVNLPSGAKTSLTKNGKRDLYWSHSDAQWLTETGMTAAELRNAKAALKTAGVLISLKAGMPYETFYRVDFIALVEQAKQLVKTSENNSSRAVKSARLDERKELLKTSGFNSSSIDNSTIDNEDIDNKTVFSIEKTNLAFSEQNASAEVLKGNKPAKEKPSASKTTKKESQTAKEKSTFISGVDEFDRDDEFNNVCKFVASFCLLYKDSEQRSRMTKAAKGRTRGHAKELIDAGKSYQALLEFERWYANTNGGKLRKAEDPRTKDFIFDKWHLFEDRGLVASTQQKPANAYYSAPNDDGSTGFEFTQAPITFELMLELPAAEDKENYPIIRQNYLEGATNYENALQEVLKYEQSNEFQIRFR